MSYYSDVFRFRGEGAVVPWEIVRRRQDTAVDGRRDPEQDRIRQQATAARSADTQLRWMVAPTLGVPSRPFDVLRRPAKDARLERLDLPPGRRTVMLDRVAAVIEVEVTAPAGARVLLTASRTAVRLDDDDHEIAITEIVAATTRRFATGSGRLRIRCGGATSARVDVGAITAVSVAWLDEVTGLPDWEPVEIVGLPFEVGTYRETKQGLVADLTDPAEAGRRRLERGLPPIGWFPTTEGFAAAPPWEGPDPAGLVKEVTLELTDEVEPLFDGRPAHEAALLRTTRDTTPTTPAGTAPPSTATLAPFDVLTLPAAADAALALALGFGTAYPAGGERGQGGFDYLVVATFEHEIPDSGGAREIATFVPAPDRHERLTPPQLLEVRSVGRSRPEAPDLPWQESAQAIWAVVDPSAGLERPTGAGFARAEGGDPTARSLLPPRRSGGPRPLVPTTTVDDTGPAAGPAASPRVPLDRWSLVDGGLEIPAASGARGVRYSVALVDVFGVWSAWEDRDHLALAPPPPGPAVLQVATTPRFTGTPAQCPATTAIDVSLDWETRTPTTLRVRVVAAPTTRAGDPPGLRPPAVVAPPATPWELTLPVVGEELRPPTSAPPGVHCVVRHLDEEGETDVAPGPAQGSARRYRLEIAHTLDYHATRWWALEAWARADLRVGPGSAWEPSVPAGDPRPPSAYAVFARAASPVPPAPPVVPQGPDVPMASTPDAEGHSHARVPLAFAGPAPATVSVWEVSEAALRKAAGRTPPPDDTRTPSERLVQLRADYDGLTAVRRRSVFRRALTLTAPVDVADVPLPRGSTDIHLFATTATTAEGLESAWPQGAPGTAPHTYLHTFIAPRVVRPAVPELRVVETPTGPVVRLSALGRIPVERFEVLATRSEAAARRAVSMGPPVAVAAAAADPSWSPTVPAEEGMRRYTAEVGLPVLPAWSAWLLRTVAVPVETVGQLAQRGARSPDSPLVRHALLPSTAPAVGPLAGRSVSSDAVAFTTETSAPVAGTPRGPHTVRVQVDSAGVTVGTVAVPFAQVTEVGDVSVRPPSLPPTADGPQVVRGPRADGRTPLGVWWRRPDPERPVEARLSLTDPLGRVATSAGTAPPVPTDPAFTLTLAARPVVAATSVRLLLATGAPRTSEWTLAISVTPRLPFPHQRPKPVLWSARLDRISSGSPVILRSAISVRHVKTRYEVVVRVARPFTFEARLLGPADSRSSLTVEVRDGPTFPR